MSFLPSPSHPWITRLRPEYLQYHHCSGYLQYHHCSGYLQYHHCSGYLQYHHCSGYLHSRESFRNLKLSYFEMLTPDPPVGWGGLGVWRKCVGLDVLGRAYVAGMWGTAYGGWACVVRCVCVQVCVVWVILPKRAEVPICWGCRNITARRLDRLELRTTGGRKLERKTLSSWSKVINTISLIQRYKSKNMNKPHCRIWKMLQHWNVIG